ncbi:MAG: ATP phosphoribosyltransferase [Dehalococcoidia bacterium]
MLRLAAPTGDLRAPVAAALADAGIPFEEYAAGSRALRLVAPGEEIALRVFREKDIPIQVALGNYDLGICSGAWVQELQARHPREGVTVLRAFPFGRQRLVLAASPRTIARMGSPEMWPASYLVRIVSEFPGLAETCARRMRLPRYVVWPVWGAAEAYPPEDADLALLPVTDERDVRRHGLVPVGAALETSAWLIAGRRSLASRDLGAVLGRLQSLAPAPMTMAGAALPRSLAMAGQVPVSESQPLVRLALPDGHAQRHTYRALAAAGLTFPGYDEKSYVRRPESGIDGLTIKAIRPQDMPQQVAVGNYDLAITGRDWLLDHRSAFPSSPVVEAVDLGLSRYSIAAAVSEDVPAATLADALAWWRGQGVTTIRVASEYPNIADHFARARRLDRYQVVPVNGAQRGVRAGGRRDPGGGLWRPVPASAPTGSKPSTTFSSRRTA